MSKKTDNVYGAIENISQLTKKLEEYNQQLSAQGNASRELEDIYFGLNQEIKNLTFWFSSLYSYNGKSTSYAKKSASRENGKKGGRPPKEVTQRKKRIAELTELVIPDLQHKIKFTNDAEEESKLKKELRRAKAELKKVEEELGENVRKIKRRILFDSDKNEI